MEWLLIPAAYLVGSLQWGLYVVRITRGVDIRAVGSGRTGTTNVLRTSGKAAALIVLAADFGKGAAITVIARVVSDDPTIHAAVASAVVFGHIWPVIAGFRGGRGVATGVGTATAVDPIAAAVGIAFFVPFVAITRYVSLGSVAGVAGAAATIVVLATFYDLPAPFAVYALVTGPIIVVAHRDNIRRILEGTERRIGKPTA